MSELKQMPWDMAVGCVLALTGLFLAIGVIVLHVFGIVSLYDMGKFLVYSLALVYFGCAFVPPRL